MRKADLVSAVILVLLAVVAATGTLDLPYWADVAPGPAFAARWAAVVAGALGFVMFWQAATGQEDSAVEWPDREGIRSVVYSCVLLWAFCLSMPYAGFVTSGIVFMMAMLIGVQKRPVMPSALATLVTIAGGYGIFIKWLQIKLPLGPFGI